MSKPWFASSKRAAACVGVSAFFALAILVVSGSALAASLPEREVTLSTRGGQVLRVGDTVSYVFVGGNDSAEARWGIDPKQSGLKMGFLFRAGRLFTPLMAGDLSLPALPILDEKGEVVAQTKPLAISIASNLSEKERKSGQPPKAEPAIGPLGLPFPIWIQSALALTILGIALVGMFFLVRALRRKAAAALRKILPRKPYDQAALERMDALLKQGLIEKGSFKPLYFGISETLKFYFGERFHFDARESTTSELIALLRERTGTPGLNDGIIRKVESLFETLDPVKFADIVPSAESAREVHRVARDLITSTRKISVEPILSGPVGPGREAK